MRLFDHKLTALLLLFTLPLLFLPKINLVDINSETAGVRIDDFILLLFGSILGWSHFLLHQGLSHFDRKIGIFTLFCLLSFIGNRILVEMGVLPVDAKIFYVFRLAEYFLFFYVGIIAASFISVRALILTLFSWNFFWMLMQKTGFAGAVSIGGYIADASGRIQGIGSFPSEMGLWLNLMFCWILFDDRKNHPPNFFLHQLFLYGMFALFGGLVILTGNRISILALLICFLGKLFQEYRSRPSTVLWTLPIFIPLVLAGILTFMSQSTALAGRRTELFSTNNFELVERVWDQTDVGQDPFAPTGSSGSEYDASWWLRIHKWVYMLKIYSSHPICYAQGIGPGCAWSALDGGFLRILVETGIIGLLLFIGLFRSFYNVNLQLKWMVIAWMINMLFFDAYLAYKPMSLLFFCGGAGSQKRIE